MLFFFICFIFEKLKFQKSYIEKNAFIDISIYIDIYIDIKAAS